MRRSMTVALGLAVAFALAMAAGGDAEASKRKKSSAAKNKACVGTTIDGKKVNFTCKATENCCFDGLMAKGNCTPKGQVCF